VARWGDRINYVAVSASEQLGIKAALVRPDGVTAWACEEKADLEKLTEIVKRWFGRPKDFALSTSAG
jgi:hypothetical protein